jgi:hypothetical protein
MRHHMTWSPADMAAMQAQMAKMQAAMAKAEAAHKATRAKILAALTPAHKAYLADLIGQLAVAANPDPRAATAKLDAILSASEKANILAIHKAAEAQMMTEMKTMMPPMGAPNVRYKRVLVVKDANGTTTSNSDSDDAMPAGGPPGAPMAMDVHMKRMKAMTAGEILMHLVGGEAAGAMSMMWRHPHPMAPQATP